MSVVRARGLSNTETIRRTWKKMRVYPFGVVIPLSLFDSANKFQEMRIKGASRTSWNPYVLTGQTFFSASTKESSRFFELTKIRLTFVAIKRREPWNAVRRNEQGKERPSILQFSVTVSVLAGAARFPRCLLC